MEEFGDVVSVTYCDTDELVSDFGRLMDGAWRDGLSDVVLEDEGGTQLEGHGLMLRARSEYLAVALEERWGGWNPGARRPGRLVKPAASRESLLAVVRFIYTAYVIFTDENVYDIMLLAREMLVWDLVVLGREYVRSRLQISSAGFHAERCGLSGDEELQEAVAEYFVLEGEKILTSRGFLNYTRSQLEAVLSHENLGIDEDIVLLAAQNWSEVYCNFDREEAKKVLADLIASKLVRCLSLSSEAFDTLEENGLIPSEQAYLRFMYKAVLVNGRRYSIQSSFFRPSIRCSYVVTESKHPFLKTTFRRIIKLNKAADAIYIEVRTPSFLPIPFSALLCPFSPNRHRSLTPQRWICLSPNSDCILTISVSCLSFTCAIVLPCRSILERNLVKDGTWSGLLPVPVKFSHALKTLNFHEASKRSPCRVTALQ